MKSSNTKHRVAGEGRNDTGYVDFAHLLPEEHTPSDVDALLNARPEHPHRNRARFAYSEDREIVDFVDERALHCIVEDLQFGHDLRLNF
jgi:hypothetical protein